MTKVKSLKCGYVERGDLNLGFCPLIGDNDWHQSAHLAQTPVRCHWCRRRRCSRWLWPAAVFPPRPRTPIRSQRSRNWKTLTFPYPAMTPGWELRCVGQWKTLRSGPSVYRWSKSWESENANSNNSISSVGFFQRCYWAFATLASHAHYVKRHLCPDATQVTPCRI